MLAIDKIAGSSWASERRAEPTRGTVGEHCFFLRACPAQKGPKMLSVCVCEATVCRCDGLAPAPGGGGGESCATIRQHDDDDDIR